MIVSLRAAGLAAAVLAGAIAPASGWSQGAPPQGAQGLKPPPATRVPSKPQLKAMYLDHELFTPDKWWTYDGQDLYTGGKARFMSSVVAQRGTVSLGSRFEPNHGGLVKYEVHDAPTPEAGRGLFAAISRLKPTPKAVKRTVRKLRAGDEGTDVVDIQSGQGRPVFVRRLVVIRYGRFVVSVEGSSNMRALVARPARGERPWLSEPVMDRVLAAVTERWRDYPSLIAK
jgi:hypothetical protein